MFLFIYIFGGGFVSQAISTIMCLTSKRYFGEHTTGGFCARKTVQQKRRRVESGVSIQAAVVHCDVAQYLYEKQVAELVFDYCHTLRFWS